MSCRHVRRQTTVFVQLSVDARQYRLLRVNRWYFAGFSSTPDKTVEACACSCQVDSTCQVYQFNNASAPYCWIGALPTVCRDGGGWISRGRSSVPLPPSECAQAECAPATDDSQWRAVDLPHDFVVEGAFSSDADMLHGYLPFGWGWYRKHFKLPYAVDPNACVVWLEFEGIQAHSLVWLNGVFLGRHASGYTPSRYQIPISVLQLDGDNVLAVKAEATNPDSWWYE